MKKMKEKGFTLIELISVLVIMAIIALIVTPLVMSIIRKARISADKRSVDAYGRSIELAITGYLLDTGSFPTSIDQLTIEYSGEEVVCSTTQLSSDSDVYLAGCTVNGRSVDGYTYGKEEVVMYKEYKVGDMVTYKNINYYVLKESHKEESTVTLLKAEPLTVNEVNTYGGVGTANNHVNMNVPSTASYYQTAYDRNGYGAMQYYSSDSCIFEMGIKIDLSGCKNDYESSEIKYVVDAWKTVNAPAALEARLIKSDEYVNECLEEEYQSTPSDISTRLVPQFDWMYNNDYRYWTMTVSSDDGNINAVLSDGGITMASVYSENYVVRPVIVLDKSVL